MINSKWLWICTKCGRSEYKKDWKACIMKFIIKILYKNEDRTRHQQELQKFREKLKLAAKKSKQGRNEKCACGSGKKYKNCCGQ
jgi:uncharacterized protein YchJ